MPGGFPDRARVRLVYDTRITIATTTSPGTYVFSGNSVFDPDVTAAGAQPVNYDDWTGLYDRYRVHGSSMTITALTSSSSTLVIGPAHSSTALSSAALRDSFASQPYVKRFTIAANGGGLNMGLPVRVEMSSPKFFGMSEQAFEGSDECYSLYTTNPAHRWYWIIASQHVDTSSAATLYADVRVEYDVEFFDRTDPLLDLLSKMLRKVSASNYFNAVEKPIPQGISTASKTRPIPLKLLALANSDGEQKERKEGWTRII